LAHRNRPENDYQLPYSSKFFQELRLHHDHAKVYPVSADQTQRPRKKAPWRKNTESGILRYQPAHCASGLNRREINRYD
jgi:hypothetical protein